MVVKLRFCRKPLEMMFFELLFKNIYFRKNIQRDHKNTIDSGYKYFYFAAGNRFKKKTPKNYSHKA